MLIEEAILSRLVAAILQDRDRDQDQHHPIWNLGRSAWPYPRMRSFGLLTDRNRHLYEQLQSSVDAGRMAHPLF
jgi:hypothetical protein